MAVLEAVRGYEYYAGLPPSNDRDRAKEEEEADAVADEILSSENGEPAEEVEEGEWTKVQLKEGLDELLEEDLDSLLLEHDQFVGAESRKSVRKCHLISWKSRLNVLQFSIFLHISLILCYRITNY